MTTNIGKTELGARDVVREAHPEVCFRALTDRAATEYAKTGQPAAAFWERVAILEAIDSDVVAHVREGNRDMDAEVGNDDIADRGVGLPPPFSPALAIPHALAGR